MEAEKEILHNRKTTEVIATEVMVELENLFCRHLGINSGKGHLRMQKCVCKNLIQSITNESLRTTVIVNLTDS